MYPYNDVHFEDLEKVGIFFSSCHKNDDAFGGILENFKSMWFLKVCYFYKYVWGHKYMYKTSQFFSSV